MTFSQAALTGRRFRRKSDPKIHYWVENAKFYFSDGTVVQEITNFQAEHLLATDWEADPLALMLTAEDIKRAARGFQELSLTRRLSAAEFAKQLCDELGLTEPK